MKEQEQRLREIFFREELTQPPVKREYAGEWVEVVVGIGSDYVAYISMPSDAMVELVKRTTVAPEDQH